MSTNIMPATDEQSLRQVKAKKKARKREQEKVRKKKNIGQGRLALGETSTMGEREEVDPEVLTQATPQGLQGHLEVHREVPPGIEIRGTREGQELLAVVHRQASKPTRYAVST